MLKNYFKIAWKVLMRKKFYTAVTLFCISFTLFIVIAISSFVAHVNDTVPPKSKFNRVLKLYGLTVYSFKDGQEKTTSNGFPTYYFIEDYVKTLETPELVGIHSMMPIVVNIIKNGQKNEFRLKYTDANFWKITDFHFFEGKPFSQKDIDQKAKVVILDKQARDFFFPSNEVATGKYISIKNIRYRVTGVVQGVDQMNSFISSNMYFPITINDRYMIKNRHNHYTFGCGALVLAKNRRDFKKIKVEYQSMLRKLEKDIEGKYWYNRLTSYMEPGYMSIVKSFIHAENKRLIHLISYIFSTLIGFLILIYLMLPASNLANIQLNRIYERHDEIGIRKTFGASRNELLKQFIIENIIITIIGAVIAVVLTAIFIWLFNKSGVIPDSNIRINGKVLLFSISIAIVFALMSGITPALRMSKLQITNILSKEEL